jgi:hypothetical protein
MFRSIAASLVASPTGHFGDDFAQLLNHFLSRAPQYLAQDSQHSVVRHLMLSIN